MGKPQMPMPSPIKNDEVGSAPSSIAPIPEANHAASGLDTVVGSEVDLAPPIHSTPSSEADHSNSQVVAPVAPKEVEKGLKVQALEKGFYNQHRIRENEVFVIKKWEDRGRWMKFLDPDLQKKHLEEIKAKK